MGGMTATGPARPGEPPGFITKILVPRRRPDVLSRPRLTNFLHRHLDRKLVLICAPAGYGKTTLLVEFAHQTELPVCWYSLGESDADPQVFLEYLVAAIQRRFPSFGERTRRYLGTAGAKDLEAAAGLLVTELHETVEGPFVLVLDDVHTVDGEHRIQALLDLLIAGLPPNCCCLLASRTIPHIRFSRLVANREAAGLGTADLRFTAAEIEQLLSRHFSLLLPRQEIEALARESEGWIAGLILTSHTLWQGLVRNLIEAKQAGGPIFDYLAREVFDFQEPEVQDFLLRSSVLPRLSPATCDALLGRSDSAEVLAALDKRHLLLARLEGEGEWYRYHHLFQEFLQARLRRDDPAEFARLHSRAGELAEAHGDVDSAIAHYLEAGEAARATDLVERMAEATIDAGRAQTLLRWCEMLPDPMMVDRPWLQIQRARAAFETGDMALVRCALDAAWAAALRRADRRLLTSTLVWRSTALSSQGRHQEAIADCQSGLAMAEELGDAELIALASKQLGLALGAAGSMAEAIPLLERALAGYAALGDHFNQGILCHNLGIAWKRRGETERARAALDRACQHWRATGNTGKLAGTLVVLGNLHHELGHFDEAMWLLSEAERSARESGYLRIAGYAVWSMADVLRDNAEIPRALAEYDNSLPIAHRVGDRSLEIGILDGLGRCHLYAGDMEQARGAILRARQMAGRRDSAYEQGICEDAYGLLCLQEGALAEAIGALEQACQWLAPSAPVRELARARLHLALALLQAGDTGRAIPLAAGALADLPGGARDPLLAAEGRLLAPLLHAVSRDGPAWLGEVVRRLGPASAPQPSRPAIVAVPSSPAPRSLRCYSLGRMEVQVEGQAPSSEDRLTPKGMELLFYLLAEGPVPRDQAIEALWPEVDSARGLSAFHVTVHRLRRALFPGCVERRGSRWGIPPELSLWSDDREFERLATTVIRPGSDGRAEDWLASAARAVDLYAGPYLPGLEAEWCYRRRRRLEALYLRLLQSLVERACRDGQHEQAIRYAELYLETDPDNEAVHEAVMRSYVQVGNRAAALRHFQRYAEQLRDELQAEPSARLRLLSEQLARSG